MKIFLMKIHAGTTDHIVSNIPEKDETLLKFAVAFLRRGEGPLFHMTPQGGGGDEEQRG